MKAEILGIAELSKAMKKFNQEAGKAFAAELPGIARMVLKDAVDITPVDTGALRASGDYFVQGSGWNAEAIVGFGFPVRGYFKGNRERIPSEYAVYQHDEPYEVRFLEISAENNSDDANYLVWQAIASL